MFKPFMKNRFLLHPSVKFTISCDKRMKKRSKICKSSCMYRQSFILATGQTLLYVCSVYKFLFMAFLFLTGYNN